MSVDPLVSVILCVYDQEEFVADAVESVLAQTYPRVELVAVDNGSTDGSAAVLQRFADRANVQVVLHPTNENVTTRLNDAIRRSSGELVSIIYGDDFYLPEKLERQVSLFAALPPSFGVVYGPGFRENVITGERWVESELELSGRILKGLLGATRTFINPISPLVRRECFDRYPFQESMFTEGEGIYARIAVGYEFRYDPEPLVVMREHARNIGKAVARNAEVWLEQLRRLEAQPDFPADCIPIVQAARVRSMERVGWWALRIAGDHPLARRSMIRAIRWNGIRSPRPRALLGLALSLVPAPLLGLANRVVNRLRRYRVVLARITDYR